MLCQRSDGLKSERFTAELEHGSNICLEAMEVVAERIALAIRQLRLENGITGPLDVGGKEKKKIYFSPLSF